jgi:hypothetical protein
MDIYDGEQKTYDAGKPDTRLRHFFARFEGPPPGARLGQSAWMVAVYISIRPVRVSFQKGWNAPGVAARP